jgi:hypothetical protein
MSGRCCHDPTLQFIGAREIVGGGFMPPFATLFSKNDSA